MIFFPIDSIQLVIIFQEPALAILCVQEEVVHRIADVICAICH